MLGYNYTGDTLSNGRAIPRRGKWLKWRGEIWCGYAGIHCCKHPYDALMHGWGYLLHRVELKGDIQTDPTLPGLWVGRQWRILSTIDATDVLRRFACDAASEALHLWDAPQVVRDYLRSADESLAPDALWDARKAAIYAETCLQRTAAQAAWWAAAMRYGDWMVACTAETITTTAKALFSDGDLKTAWIRRNEWVRRQRRKLARRVRKAFATRKEIPDEAHGSFSSPKKDG